MRKNGAILGITALAVVVLSPLPAAAFSIHLGPFYFRVPDCKAQTLINWLVIPPAAGTQQRRGEPYKFTLKPARWLRAGGFANNTNNKTIDQRGNSIVTSRSHGNGGMEEIAAELNEELKQYGNLFILGGRRHG
jgi:hypothetical protein